MKNWKRYDGITKGCTHIIFDEDAQMPVAEIKKSSTDFEDASLMAAAPELLECLKELLIWANIKEDSAFMFLHKKCEKAIKNAQSKR